MRIEPEIWEKIDRGLVRIYRAKDIETQGRVMMELIMELVPADSVLINCFEVATGCYTARIIPEETATAEDVEELKPYLHESPFPAYHLATGDPRWKITTDFMPLEDYRATALYRSMQRWKVEIQMCAMLAFVDGTAHAITVNRSSGRFEESEREILDILHPHLVTSYLNAMAFDQVDRTLNQFRCLMDQAAGAYGYLERDGKVAWLQPRALEWLDEFFPDGQRTRDDLPDELQKLALKIMDEGRDAGHLETQGAASSLFACLAASPMGGWMLRLEIRPRHIRPRFRDPPDFSPRVNEVLCWMVEGKRNGEIAVILGISARTVEKHVAVILKVLGVEKPCNSDRAGDGALCEFEC